MKKAGKPVLVVDGRPEKLEGRAPASVRGLLAGLKVSPQEALVRVDGHVRPDDFPLAGARKIEVIRVVFGG